MGDLYETGLQVLSLVQSVFRPSEFGAELLGASHILGVSCRMAFTGGNSLAVLARFTMTYCRNLAAGLLLPCDESNGRRSGVLFTPARAYERG